MRVFGVGDTSAPRDFDFPVYSFSRDFPGFRPHTPGRNPGKTRPRILGMVLRLLRKDKRIMEEEWLAKIIRHWQPTIVHTLGLDPSALTYYDVFRKFNLKGLSVWLLTTRGGPEFALKRLLKEEEGRIRRVLENCDRFIADNQQNYDYALELGLEPEKIASIGVVPGTGGVEVDQLSNMGRVPPSERKRMILWPKAYECPASKALPVLEAIRLCWKAIRPCEIYMTAMIPETRMWLQTLPQDIRDSCHQRERIPRNDLLELMAQARIMLSPSLSDGIPNTLYEAMAAGSFPILSPLETIQAVVANEKNVLFARNLYPQEIADALIKAMNDDELVDRAYAENLKLVKRLADRKRIQEEVVNFYLEVAEFTESHRAPSNRK